MGTLMVLLRFGTPWRTFWGYINGHSERFQIFVPLQKKINLKQNKMGEQYEMIIIGDEVWAPWTMKEFSKILPW